MSKRSRDFVIIGLSVILYLFVARFWNPPAPVTPGGDTVVLGVQARIVLGLLCVAILFWITEVVPFGITALLVLILMPVLGATEGLIPGNGSEPVHGLKQGLDMLAAWGFGNRIIFFFLGVFLLTAAIKESGLGQRMAVNLLIRVGTETRRVIFSFLLLGTLLSMWITDMAVAALMLPLGVNLLKSAELEPGKTQFGKALMIACAWGAIFGGVGTPAGCGPNPIAIAYLEELAGVHVSFPDWMKLGVPVSLLLAPVGWIVLILTFPPEMKYLPITKEKLKNQLHEIGPMNQGEINTLIVFVAVVALWVFKDVIRSLIGIALPMEWVSMAGGVALFIPGLRVLTWNEAESAIPWGAIVLVMASLALGMAAYKSGAARWMAWVLLGWIQGIPPVGQLLVVITGILAIKVFLASNTVTGIILIPILITLANDLGLDAWFLVAPAAFSSSLGIILVTQTPTSIIPYTSGYFSIRDFAWAGVIMTVLMIGILAATLVAMGALWGTYRI